MNGKLRQVWYDWFPVGNEYGQAFNETRNSIGVLELPDDWTTSDNAYEFKTWRPEGASNIRTMKTVRIENDTIVAEIDYLKNDIYTMQIKYSYLIDTPWEIKIQYEDNDLSLSKSQADSVLAVWGVR